ncbi:SDR family oxidoreductase [Nocardia testacea]|uniref:SDR family oxidoreductase n=1 Tax=Nocardia testacea TaxID=248551 RepID=UPI003C2B4E5E
MSSGSTPAGRTCVVTGSASGIGAATAALLRERGATVQRALNRWVRRAAPSAEWAGAGIALNAVAPGVVDTPAAAWILGDDEVRRTVETASPQPFGGFPGRPEWVAELLCWLAGPDNRFVTGQVVFADGGAEAAAVGDRHWL